jgi:multidrug efflux pump subunit AcrA (membrane-fusion protein)
MFKGHKHWRVILVFIVLISLWSSQYAYATQNESRDNSVKSKPKTVKAYIGDYTEVSSLKNMGLTALKYADLRIKEAEGNLVEVLVQRGQIVKKDQPLISYTIPVDELILEEKEILMKKSEESFKEACEQKERDIAENLSKIMTMDGSSIETQILRLNIQKMQLSYEQYVYQTQKSLDKQREELEKQKADKELKYVLAPFDGFVYNIDTQMKKGTILNSGAVLASIMDINSIVLQADSAGVANMWYNLDVEIYPIFNRREDTENGFKGKVVAIDSLLNGEAKTGKIYIRSDSLTEKMGVYGINANILADGVRVKNVLLIPSEAVKTEDIRAVKTLKYVYIIDANGEERKQYISGRDNGVETWVYNGLSEGQEIVIE